MIKCKNPHAYGDKCVISMNAKENPGGVFYCDIAEDFDFNGEYVLRFCKHAEYAEDVKMQTNADRIRSMTDEELAEFLRKVKAGYQWPEPEFPDVDDDWGEWLQSEVEDNEDD